MDFGLNIKAEPVQLFPGGFSAGSFLQAPFWAEFKGKYGWKPFFFKVEAESPFLKNTVTLCFSVLTRKFLKRFTLAYMPMVPESASFQGLFNGDSVDGTGFFSELIVKTAAALKPLLPGNVFCIRFDPDLDKSVFPAENVRWKLPGQSLKFLKAPGDIQPPDTVVVNLSGQMDDVFSKMKPKWRYNIRLAEKKGVEVLCFRASDVLEEKDGFSPMDIFYGLYKETAERDGIAIHGKNYYLSLFEVAGAADSGADVRLYAAKHENDILAAIITVFYGGRAVYLYGASSNKKRSLMPAYALQWKAMQDAKSAGCFSYDFYGIPPTDDEKHPMHGLYRFKTGFGGDIIHRTGSLDVPLKNTLYSLYRTAEGFRLFWFKRVVKAIKRR